MKRILTGLVLVAALAALLVLVSRASADEKRQLARFSITVTATSDGVELTCEEGCKWTELNFTCEHLPCSSAIDEDGMQ
jgi:hypothetical protein